MMVQSDSMPFLPCHSPPTRMKPDRSRLLRIRIVVGSREGRLGNSLDDCGDETTGEPLAPHLAGDHDIAELRGGLEAGKGRTGFGEIVSAVCGGRLLPGGRSDDPVGARLHGAA